MNAITQMVHDAVAAVQSDELGKLHQATLSATKMVQAIQDAEKFRLPRCPVGCIRFETTFRDVDLVCDLEYTPAEGDGWNDQRYPEDCVLVAAYVRGVNVVSLLSEDDCRDLEIEALESGGREAEEARAEAAWDRQQERINEGDHL